MPHCPLCGSTSLRSSTIKKDTFLLYGCDICGLSFIDPLPSDDVLTSFYTEYLKEKGYKYLNDQLRKFKVATLWQKRLGLLKKHSELLEKKRILEVGSGTGEWLETLEKNKIYDFVGLEIASDEFLFLQRQYQDKILKITFLDDSLKKKFDVICLWDVLEHFNNLEDSFVKMLDLLNKDGLIIFSTVNTDSFSFFIKKSKWRYFIPPEHIFYFNKKSIDFIAKKFRFEVVYYGTQPQLQAFLLSSGVGKPRAININIYKVKVFLENFFSLLFPRRGEIMTVVLRKLF